MRSAASLAPLFLSTFLVPAFAQMPSAASDTSPIGKSGLTTPRTGLGKADNTSEPLTNGPTLRGLTPKAVRTIETRRALPYGSEDWRFSGEIGTRVAPLYLLPTEAARPAKLQLSYLTAVSGMPEVSRLTVTVNDQVVGERYVSAAAQPEVLTFDIPAGSMQAGFNAVRVTARHAHRVDCSREASYELWTQILPEHSGLVFSAANAEIRDIRDLPAVRPTKAGTTRIRARIPTGIDADSLQQVSRAIQASVLLGRFSRPTVEINPEESDEPGLDLIVGTDAVVESLTNKRPAGSGPRIQTSHDPQTDRVLVTISGVDRGEVAEALRQFEALAVGAEKLPGTEAGLQALEASQGAQIVGGDTLSLAALGFETQRFAGRYYRQSGLLRMPADFYPGDYGRITLGLDAAYGAGLTQASKLNIRVNGALVSTVPLAKASGDTLRQRAAYLPLAAFKPGINTVDIEADTIAPNDQECSAGSQRDQRDRLLLGSTSELSVPALGRIGTLPNLSAAFNGGLGNVIQLEGTLVHIPNPSAEALEATLSLLAKAASVSGRAMPVKFAFEQVSHTSPHVVTIGALSDIPPATLAASGLSLEGLRRAWRTGEPSEPQLEVLSGPIRVAAAGPDIVVRSPLSDTKPVVPPLELREVAPDPKLPPSQIASGIDLGSIQTRLSINSLGWMPASLEWLEETIRNVYKVDLRSRAPGDALLEPTALVSPASTLVVSQQANPKELQTSWQSKLLPEVVSSTVIVAPSGDALRASMADLVTSSAWQKVTGQAIAYEREAASVQTLAPGAAWFIPTQPLTPANVRLIVAGWLSKNVLFYLTILFAAVVVLAGMTYRLVRTSGVREP